MNSVSQTIRSSFIDLGAGDDRFDSQFSRQNTIYGGEGDDYVWASPGTGLIDGGTTELGELKLVDNKYNVLSCVALELWLYRSRNTSFDKKLRQNIKKSHLFRYKLKTTYLTVIKQY